MIITLTWLEQQGKSFSIKQRKWLKIQYSASKVPFFFKLPNLCSIKTYLKLNPGTSWLLQYLHVELNTGTFTYIKISLNNLKILKKSYLLSQTGKTTYCQSYVKSTMKFSLSWLPLQLKLSIEGTRTDRNQKLRKYVLETLPKDKKLPSDTDSVLVTIFYLLQ